MALITIENLTDRHIKAVARWASLNGKKTLAVACERAARCRPGGDLNLAAMRVVVAAYNRLEGGGFFGPPARLDGKEQS